MNRHSATYTVTLDHNGTTTIGTFWFGWIPGAGFLSAASSSLLSPAGWTDVLTNANGTIQWKPSSSLLTPGSSLSGFEFTSSETPAQLLGTVPGGLGAGDPVTTSFVYIAAPLADPGFQLVANPAAAAPEPGTLGLTALAICGGVALRRFRSRKAL